ncbi:MAG: hypothetical protein IT257_09635 [Chitinophagaceae bacterium]|nr:hypothetical protein [Chitinophagaceae bacterium]
MKSIITVSTLLFVTASFMGIGNYIRYNDELRAKGLYRNTKTDNSSQNTVHASGQSAMTAEVLPDLPDPQSDVSQQQPLSDAAADSTTASQADQSAVHSRQRKSKKRTENTVIQPAVRDIDLRGFSRAPLEDEPPVYNTDEAVQQNTPVIISDKEANE